MRVSLDGDIKKLEAIARGLKGAEKEIRTEFYRGTARAVRPLTAAVKAEAKNFLPDNYAKEVVRTLRVKSKRYMRGPAAGITMYGSAKVRGGPARELAELNRGQLRKPLFGNRRHWYEQRVKRGFWDRTMRRHAREVRADIRAVMNDVAKRLAAGK